MSTFVAVILGIIVGAALGAVLMYVYTQAQKGKYGSEAARLMAEAYAAKKQLTDKIAEMGAYTEEIRLQQMQLMNLSSDKARITAEFQGLQKRFQEREGEFIETRKNMQLEFERMASKILEENSRKLSASNEDKLGILLSPLKEKLAEFEKKVTETYSTESRERFHLQKELESLVQLNQQLSSEAHNLTKALKGENKTQGNWGEFILTRILESSGLREGEEFIVQGKNLGLKNDDGDRFQPDVILQLPDKRHIIIDSKVSLTSYERYIHAETELEKKAFLKKHIDSIQNHVQNLGSKHYDALENLATPDFVLLFMPLESAFSAAIGSKTDLFSYAFARKIVIVSPTTLLATLKTVSSIWKLEHQNRNAAEIARQGGLLYDKLVTFTEELEKIGKNLQNASDSYENAMHRLSDGRDSLLNRAEKLKELGVKSNKQVANSLGGMK